MLARVRSRSVLRAAPPVGARWARRCGCIAVSFAASLAAEDADARDGRAGAHPGAHHAELPNLVGLRAGYVAVFETVEGGVSHTPGVQLGATYERVLLHDWLEAEVAVPVTALGHEEPTLVVPIDLHLKMPFHPVPHLSPYIAMGPVFDVKLKPIRDLYFGTSVALGTYIWTTDRFGLDVEVDYNTVVEADLVHELVFGLGPVMRF